MDINKVFLPKGSFSVDSGHCRAAASRDSLVKLEYIRHAGRKNYRINYMKKGLPGTEEFRQTFDVF